MFSSACTYPAPKPRLAKLAAVMCGTPNEVRLISAEYSRISGRLTRDRRSVGQEAGEELQRRHRPSQQEEPYRRSYSFHVGRSIKRAVRWAFGFPRGSSRPGQLALAREQ